jgi:diguanylate cyclase (GGDEF)-like protein
MYEFAPYPDFRSAAADVLQYLRSRLGFGLWMVTRTQDDTWVVLQALDQGSGVRDGDVFRLGGSDPQPILLDPTPQATPRASAVLVQESDGDANKVAVAAYVGVPLVCADGSQFGTLCGIDPSPQSEAIRDELPTIELLARMLSTVLQAELKAAAEARRAERATVDAFVDQLTGLNNRRAWDRLLATEEARCRRYGHPACVLAIDLDGLKQVNDTLGHAAGDEVLRRFGSVLRKSIRVEDIVARVGGDEFAILSVETNLAQGELFQRRLEGVLANEQITASMGLATRTQTGGLIQAWQEADAAMYVAKRHRSDSRTASAPTA